MKQLFAYHPKLINPDYITSDVFLNFKDYQISLWEEFTYKRSYNIVKVPDPFGRRLIQSPDDPNIYIFQS